MCWLGVFTKIVLKAFKTGRTNGDAWCNRDKEITSPQAHLANYMVNFAQMLGGERDAKCKYFAPKFNIRSAVSAKFLGVGCI